jgi:hypothetical protein
MFRQNIILFIILALCILNGCKAENVEERLFVTPENTVYVFYNAMYSGDGVLASQCFMIPQDFTGLTKAPFPVQIHIKNKQVVTEQEVDDMKRRIEKSWEYQFYLKHQEEYQKSGDIEIEVNVKYDDNSRVEICYLRNIRDEWKLIRQPVQSL